MASDLDSDDFELVDSLEVAKHMIAEKKPDVAKIKAWLNATEYATSSSEFHRHLSSQATGTGEWIRETPQFSQWYSSNDHGSIWIKAVPGAGKSVVAASMVDSFARNESVPVVFFFFRQIIESNRTSRSLLRDWMSQLLPFSEMLQLSLWELLEEKRDLESVSTNQLWKHLLAGLRVVDRAYCVVDALDEMNVDEVFLSQLNALGSFRPAHVKVMMTSRPKQYLQRALKDPQVIHVSLEEDLVKRDISVFVRQRAAHFGRDGVDQKTQEFIKDMVCERSQGLFLYARLMLDQIAQSIKDKDHSEASIREMVAKLPVGLEEMYNRVLFDHAALMNIHGSVQILILQLVTHSARPMRLIEIAKALEANPRIAKTGRDSKEVVRNACGPLLEIMEDEVVQILHHSFTEFLLDTRRIDKSTNEAPQFPIIEPTTAHRDIAAACLARLQADAFDAYPKDDDPEKGEVAAARLPGGSMKEFDFRTIFLQHPLVDYAAKKWPYHAKQYDIEDQGFVNTMEQFCEPQSLHFRAWLELMSGERDSAVSLKNATPLHIAAGFGLSTWGKHLIQSGANLDALDSTENSPLFWASKGGHSEVVDLLLKAGAKPDIDGYDGLKPLHVAASRNHAGVVKLLLGAGVSPTTPKPREVGRFCGNAPSSIGHHALRYASQSGHVETVLEMIPYAKTEELEQALCWAAAGGHFRLMSALLESSSVSPDVTSQIRSESIGRITGGETVLMLAVRSLEPKCVQILIEKGASVHKASSRDMDSYGFTRSNRKPRARPEARTPLHSLAQADINPATEVAAKEIMDMLLAAGADLEARDHSGNTPLLLSIGNRHRISTSSTALTLLLSVGADPCALDSDGETLLHRACQKGTTTEIASQLLAHKANPGQARSSDGATPLHCIVENIFCPVDHLHLLISHGADINFQDFNGDTLLHYACKGHSIKTEQILDAMLRLQVDVNLQNILGQTCLHLYRYSSSPSSQNREKAHSIIDAGANLELYDRNGMTVLLNGVAKQNWAMVDVLLQHPKRPSISARTFLNGKTALHLACQSRSPVEFVEKLVSHGADPKWIDNDGNTLLHETAARFEGYPEEIALVEKLVEMGVPIDARNSRRQTAAHVVAPVYADSHNSIESATRQSFISVLLRLDPRFDVNAQDIDGYTPLHFASAASESQTFNLLRAGANLNTKSFNLRTPLHCAARARQSSIIAMLLHFATESGRQIDVNAADVDGRTPLHDASRSGRPESVRLLIDTGANLQQQDKTSTTPLMACAEFVNEDKLWSCMRNRTGSTDLTIQDDFRPMRITRERNQRFRADEHTQHDTARVGVIAKMLIKAGASIDGALHKALSAKSAELVAAIRQEAKEWESDEARSFAETSLMLSIRNATSVLDSCNGYGPVNNAVSFIPDIDEATMEALLSRGVDFTKGDSSAVDGTAITKIARLGLTEYMSKIISQAKLLDDPAFTKNITEAVQTGYYKIRPLLQVACDRPFWNMDMVRLLVAEGQVNVNAHQPVKETKNHSETGNVIPGPTALHVLANGDFWWQVDAIKFLVNNGAQVDALDESGRTPLEIASTYSKYRTAACCGFFKPQCCEILLQSGADPNRVNPEGLTPLNKAGPDGDIIKILLKYGADVTAGTKGVLTSAVEAGDVQTLRIYLENGADCNVPDTSADSSYRSGLQPSLSKRYPLVTAAFLDRSTSIEMIKLLLDHGAGVDLPVSDEETLIHYLFQHTKTSALRPLIEIPGFEFNIRDQKGRTVFMAACNSHVRSESTRGFVPREEENRRRAEYIPAYLLLANSERYGSSIDYLAVDNEGKHIIMYLLPKWDNKVAERFLPIPGVKVLIRQKDNAGFSPLHYALRNHQMRACFQFIKEGNADLLEPDPNGDTALHHLCRCHYMSETQRSLPLMQKFLELDGSINARNKLGETPLLTHLASGYQPHSEFGGTKHTDNFSFFISNGADFRAAKNNGETALHVVARRPTSSGLLQTNARGEVDYNAEVFRALVELGCDPLKEDEEGRTALDVAAAMGNQGILGLYQRKKEA